MKLCLHCEAAINLQTLHAEFAYDTKKIPWYRPVDPTYTCSSCGKQMKIGYRLRSFVVLGLVFIAGAILRTIVSPWLIETFTLVGTPAELITHELPMVFIIIGVIFSFRVGSKFIPAKVP